MKSGRRSKSSEARVPKSGELRVVPGSSRGVLREFANKFTDSSFLVSELQEWLEEKLGKISEEFSPFEAPFSIDELQQLDYALEGVLFQQLLRMHSGSAFGSSTTSALALSDMYYSAEDFLHASIEGLWEAFWDTDDADSMPYHVAGPRSLGSKLHSLSMDKISGRGRAAPVPGVALISKTSGGGGYLWDHVAQFIEVKPQIASSSAIDDGVRRSRAVLTSESLGCALFHGLLILLARASLDRRSFRRQIDTAYVLLLDTRYGGVLKLRGDISKLEMNLDSVYSSAAEWVRKHAEIYLSDVLPTWTGLGNPCWGDVGTLQLLMATYLSMEQFSGSPRRTIMEMASDHNARVARRKAERKVLEAKQHQQQQSLQQQQQQQENGYDSSRHHHSHRRAHREIVEVDEEDDQDSGKESENFRLEPGTILWLEDAHWQRGFQIHEGIGGERRSVYGATSLDDAGKPLAVYVGAHPSLLDPSWEDMSMWYEVQRQTRVLNTMKQRGISSKYLPQMIASGRLMHPGPCTKKSPNGRCDHPWCGTPVLVTSPVGESLGMIIEREGFFTSEQALRCCHDCLSALRSSNSASIQHGDINPEHLIRVSGVDGDFYYVLVDWGRAVMEDRDSAAIDSLRFSSTSALQEGKLCPASDAESLVYVLYFVCGGKTPEFDTMEAALQWRERVWGRRAIQQQLGEVSAVLKAFADYVDSLCGTPYAVDYDIWLRRLSRALHHDEPGKKIEYPSTSARIEYVAESSGTSSASMTTS